MTRQELWDLYYKNIYYHIPGRMCWRGIRVDKSPNDLMLYAQVMFKRKPQYVIETGTRHGGSALFFGDMLMLTGGRKIFSIDILKSPHRQSHPFVEYIDGSSIDIEIVLKLSDMVSGSVMVSLDSSHEANHVERELALYSNLVAVGQYLVVEDCYKAGRRYPPLTAVTKFLQENARFRRYDLEKQFLFSTTRGGWLRRIR